MDNIYDTTKEILQIIKKSCENSKNDTLKKEISYISSNFFKDMEKIISAQLLEDTKKVGEFETQN